MSTKLPRCRHINKLERKEAVKERIAEALLTLEYCMQTGRRISLSERMLLARLALDLAYSETESKIFHHLTASEAVRILERDDLSDSTVEDIRDILREQRGESARYEMITEAIAFLRAGDAAEALHLLERAVPADVAAAVAGEVPRARLLSRLRAREAAR